MSSSPRRTRRWADRAAIALLLAITGIPLIGTALGLDMQAQLTDMRHLSEFPSLRWNLRSFLEWPGAFDCFLKDHFGFRGPLIRALSQVKVCGLHTSASANVRLGLDGWLYFSHDGLGSDYDEVRPFTLAELEQWRRVLQHRQQWLAQRGCRYLLMIPPDKQTIYPEHLDPSLQARHAGVRLSQLLDYLARNLPELTVLDVRQQLMEAKQHERVYYVTDSHWNHRGALLGYEALARQLAQWFPQVQPFEPDQFDAVEEITSRGDLAGLLALSGAYRERVVRLNPRFRLNAHISDVPVLAPRAQKDYGHPYATECPNSSWPRGVLFHDSFAVGPLLQLLPEHFQHLAMIWDDNFHPDVIEREQPDVVIQQMVERKLGYVIPNDVNDGP